MSASGWPEPSTGTRSVARGLGDLVAELVDLGDRPLQVALGDVVGGHRHGVADGIRGPPASSYRTDAFVRALPRLRDPLQALEVEERLRPADDLRAPQAEQELLGRLEGAHADAARCRRPGARGRPSRPRRQVVLAREAQRLVVVALEEEARVVHLEHVDLGQVPVQRPASGIVCRRSNGCGR